MLLRTCWAFSIGADGATHKGDGYFDVRLCFPVDGAVANIHAIAIPTLGEAHTGANYAHAMLRFIELLCPGAISKIVGLSTDGAANMMGCVKGFNTIVSNAVVAAGGGRPYIVWCNLHQVNILVGKLLAVFDESYQFRSKLSSVIAFVRSHPSLNCEIGYSATYAEVRWTSIHQSCSWISPRMTEILAFATATGKSGAMPRATWWLCLFAVENITYKICNTLKAMQAKVIFSLEQVKMLTKLRNDLMLATQSEDGPGGLVGYCSTKICHFVGARDMNAYMAYRDAAATDKHDLELAVSTAIELFVVGLDKLCAKKLDVPPDLQAPHELATTELGPFMDVLERHRGLICRYGGFAMQKAIASERAALEDAYQKNEAVRSSIDSSQDEPFEKVWKNYSTVYPNLSMFAAGLATVLPSTHTVEADFSILKITRSDSRRSLSNYAMEGQMQSKQYKELEAAVTSMKRATHRIAPRNATAFSLIA
jgi:hypothetical protein